MARTPALHRFEIYVDKTGGWRWRLRAPNKKIVADSGESYKTPRNARTAIAALARAFKRGFQPTLAP